MDVTIENNAKLVRDSIGLASEDEIAAVLQVSHETLATWRTKKKGPPSFKLGKRVFYLLSAFNEWVLDEMARQQGRPPISRSIPREYKPFKDTTGDWMR